MLLSEALAATIISLESTGALVESSLSSARVVGS